MKVLDQYALDDLESRQTNLHRARSNPPASPYLREAQNFRSGTSCSFEMRQNGVEEENKTQTNVRIVTSYWLHLQS